MSTGAWMWLILFLLLAIWGLADLFIWWKLDGETATRWHEKVSKSHKWFARGSLAAIIGFGVWLVLHLRLIEFSF